MMRYQSLTKWCFFERFSFACFSPLPMRTPRKAAGSPLPLDELRTEPTQVVGPCFGFLYRDRPTDPLVAGERREGLPGGEGVWGSREGGA